jgi:diguanylate cyclase (GGDEF)-like protein
MERRAKTDPLTDLANRRGVEEALARETDRSRRYGAPLSVMMLDVDQLKDVNDQIGHPAGDAILTNLAAILFETVRSVDVPGRWAGDEFLLVLPDTSSNQAEQLARRLQARVRERPAVLGDRRIATSVSIGVAEYRKDESLESLIHRVDQAMYAAKHGGRDRLAVADPPA